MRSNRNLLAGSLLGVGALLAAATGISIAAAADDATNTAQPAPQGMHAWRHHGLGPLLAKLNLTSEQKAEVKSIMAGAGPQLKGIHQEMRANSLKLRQTQPNDPNYAAVVAQVTQANGSLHTQLITQKESVRAQIFKLLTPEQQTQLASLQAQMQGRTRAQ
jgi:Spy/CpxP family protein refolding chaperone